MKNLKKIVVLLMCVSMMALCAACSSNADMTFMDCESMDDAYLQTEFWLDAPQEINGYGERDINVSKNKKAIQVLYQATEGDDQLTLYKAKGKFTPDSAAETYEEESTITPFGIDVTTKGDDGKINLATWSEDGFTFSAKSTNGVTEGQMTELVVFMNGDSFGC